MFWESNLGELMKPLVFLAVSAMVLTGCSEPVSLSGRPVSADEARSLMRQVADNASCGSLEDYSFNNAHQIWAFTCQNEAHTFDLTAYGSNDALTAATRTLALSEAVYLAKGFYSITAAPGLGETADPSWLDPFK
jgi:hypothetical protein